ASPSCLKCRCISLVFILTNVALSRNNLLFATAYGVLRAAVRGTRFVVRRPWSVVYLSITKYTTDLAGIPNFIPPVVAEEYGFNVVYSVAGPPESSDVPLPLTNTFLENSPLSDPPLKVYQ